MGVGGVAGNSGCGAGSDGISGSGSRSASRECASNSTEASRCCEMRSTDARCESRSGARCGCESGSAAAIGCSVSDGGSGCARKMLGPSGRSRCDCSAMRCFKPAIQRRLRSSCDTEVEFSTSVRGVDLGGGVCARNSACVRVGMLLSTARASVAPRRCAQSIALSPRLSRTCGSAPASSSSEMRCV